MVKRCRWVSDSQDEKMVAYHDQEFGQPVFDDDRLLFELLTLELFQSGLSWKTVLNKRENFKRAFADFDVEKVATFDNQDVERLLADSGIIRNRMKIDATINNAKQIQRLQNEGKSFSELVWQPTNGQTLQIGVGANEHVPSQTDLSVDFSKKLKKLGFKFVGPVTMESFLEAVGVENAHDLDCAFR
ncbi:DNA-3-methyladenine glycosylase I [Fructobacillus pseudoficulneus]|uniref:DNA-3-methyladenine glycosylase I n=1 Tax=Fructobacillus pseudoficulneus TaxID=220714 RepID=A0A3F3GWU8_9LACO|nr:DNA-3-methyladenine glycosylase I [Fructobacillus pseudoficulneus]GAP03166.1 DNA-3-methyladenine glycosylase I [Fructobacillus pseudoficulneus]SEH40907.1 DNA-3-methyladenine glycosylase I [Fructobacillus pseudoficulneus]